MATAIHHAMSSARAWGGEPEQYLAIHEWFDQSKEFVSDFRHRGLRHHTEGIAIMEQLFGRSIVVVVDGKEKVVPTKWVGEQHMREDFGFVPVPSQWLLAIQAEPWMTTGARRLSKELERSVAS